MAKEQKKEIKACSNCTFMELKLPSYPAFHIAQMVQIVPLWN